MRHFDVTIIGAGGAGLMCALLAGQRGLSVCLLDHNYKVGRKILISGGGRCNFTNIYAGPDNYLSENPHFCKSALSQYTPDDFISLVSRHRIRFHEKKLGQLFCDGSAQQIVDMLVNECELGNITFSLATRILSVKKQDIYLVTTNHEQFSSESLVIATGGLSIPQIGATGFGYEIARQFGLKIIEPQPALAGLNLSKKERNRLGDLAGVSLDTAVECNGKVFRENTLITHTGLSGPAILQASLYWQEHGLLTVNVIPDLNLYDRLKERKEAGSKIELKNFLADILPKRFAERWCEIHVPSKPLAECPDQFLQDVSQMLSSWTILPAGSVGFAKAEVTRGGVDTSELSSKTMESRKVPKLFFIGEVVDVTGQLGGYNFQWAWASAFACAQAL